MCISEQDSIYLDMIKHLEQCIQLLGTRPLMVFRQTICVPNSVHRGQNVNHLIIVPIHRNVNSGRHISWICQIIQSPHRQRVIIIRVSLIIWPMHRYVNSRRHISYQLIQSPHRQLVIIIHISLCSISLHKLFHVRKTR